MEIPLKMGRLPAGGRSLPIFYLFNAHRWRFGFGVKTAEISENTDIVDSEFIVNVRV